MNMLALSCYIIGVDSARLESLHTSTKDRIRTFAIAIVIPAVLWAITGYVIASNIFRFDRIPAIAIGIICALLIYMIERIVIATPKNRHINWVRLLIGFVIALLGSATFDLVLFEKEVSGQLIRAEEARINQDYMEEFARQYSALTQKRLDWLSAQDAANCEANGTCGSKTRNIGPITIQLSKHAETLHQDYLVMQNKIDDLSKDKAEKLLRALENAPQEAGLLARIDALHQYVWNNKVALIAWLLFFSLILFFELIVVLTKLAFGETVDDRIDRMREQIKQHRVESYMDFQLSPLAAARNLIANA